jgi:MATE family multidrug resistance protein
MSTSETPVLAPLRITPPPVTRHAFRALWQAESGYREVLQLAWPLFLSQGSTTILHFVDRMFLTWHSPEGMAAVGPAGMLAFTIQAFFLGITGYAAAFVAQYTGAGKQDKAVATVWQAIYLSIVAALLNLLFLPMGSAIFRLAGHSLVMQQLEREYFSVFMYGAFVFIASSAVSAYFIGKGKTKLVLWISLVSLVVNIVFDYLLIFGALGFPRLGVTGAALASVIAQGVSLLLGFIWFLREDASRANRRLDFALTGRLLRFGTANGVQFALDIMGWTLFLLIIGRLGMVALGATNLAFQMNTFAFFPIIGVAMAVSTLVGQSLGKNRVELADRAVWCGLHIGLVFTFVVGVLYITIPRVFLLPFAAEANPATFAPVQEMTIILLRFVAAYCLFDVGNLIFSSALKGAGDTLFVMFLVTSIVFTLVLLPTMLWCVQPGGLGVYGAWTFLTVAVCILSFTFLWRYLHGRWRSMRVIEQEVIA